MEDKEMDIAETNQVDEVIEAIYDSYRSELDRIHNKYRLRLIRLGFTSPMATAALEREAKA